MKPERLAMITVVAYASANNILAKKLASITPTINMAISYIVPLSIAIIATSLSKEKNIWPHTHWVWIWAIIMGMFYYIGDFAWFSGIQKGGSLLVMTSIISVFPVLTVAIDIILTKGRIPSIHEWMAWLLMAIGIICIAFGISMFQKN